MFNIIKNDFYKLYKTYSIYVLIIALDILAAVITTYMYKEGILSSSKDAFGMFENIAFYNLILFVVIYFGGYISDEYGSGTIKLSLIYSITRNEFIFSKFITFFANALIITTVNLAIGFFSTLVLCKEMSSDVLLIIGYNYFLIIPVMGIAALGLVISIILDKSAYVAYIFLSIFIVAKLFLSKLGVANIANDISINNIKSDGINIFIVSAIYIIIGLGISLLLFRKKDIR